MIWHIAKWTVLALLLAGCQLDAAIGTTTSADNPVAGAPVVSPPPTAPVSLPPPWLAFQRESCGRSCLDFRISVWPDGSFRWRPLAALSGDENTSREQAGQFAPTDLQRLRDRQAELERLSASLVLHNGRPECPEIIRDQPLLLLQRLTPAPGWKLLLGSCRGHAQEVEMDALMQDIARLLDRRINPERSSR